MTTYQKEFERKLGEFRNRNLYLYGAGNMGEIAYKILSYFGLRVVGYLVTQGGGGELNGLPIHEVMSVDLNNIKDVKVILTLNDAYHNEVKKLLHQKGVYDIDDSFSIEQKYFFAEIYRKIFEKEGINLREEILDLGAVKFQNPYLKEEMSPFWTECGDIILPPIFHDDRFLFEGKYEYGPVSLGEKDIVLDCGANIGLFSAYAASKKCEVYAFEPLIDQLGKVLQTCSELNGENIIHIPCALSDYDGTTLFNISHLIQGSCFLSDVSPDSKCKIVEDVIEIDVTTIDSFVESHGLSRVDFIKADIEGAERQMLRGATRVLREFAPKLAICTYHYPDDPQVLESIIKSANPEYKVLHKWKKLFAYV